MPTVDFATGFECRATAQITSGFIENSGAGSNGPGIISTNLPRSGARSWRNNDTFGSNAYRRFLPARATRVMGCGWYPWTASAHNLIWLMDGQVAQVGIRFRADGKFEICRGDGSGFPTGTILATSTIAVSTVSVFHHLEFRATINNTTGSADLYLDSDPTPVVSVSGVDTQATTNATSDGIGWAGYGVNGANSGAAFDDLYTSDDRLAVPDQKILGINISAGNGALTGSTPSTGSDRGAMLDEVTSNDDTDYNIFDNGEIDSYLHTALSGVPLPIRFVALWGRSKKIDYGPAAVKLGWRIGGVNYVGTESYQSGGYINHSEFYNLSPATGVAFTKAEIDGSELIVSRTV